MLIRSERESNRGKRFDGAFRAEWHEGKHSIMKIDLKTNIQLYFSGCQVGTIQRRRYGCVNVERFKRGTTDHDYRLAKTSNKHVPEYDENQPKPTIAMTVTMAARATKDWRLDCKVYIGDLGYGAAKQEIEDVFQRYGPLRNVWVARNPPGFAFVEFQDPRDAEDATKALDGTRVNGRRVQVEMSSGKSRWGKDGPPKRGGGYRDDWRQGGSRGGGRGGGYSGGRGRSRSPPPRRRDSPSPRRRGRSDSRSRSNSPYRRRSRSPVDRKKDW
ncbi:splicing factor, arginine/serine-rich 3 [Mytilus galloprovincialis]|uniref:Splicing factor, arginine/serine-rich 3 n=2 Tax=Mytilus TaxID=6548 RepID=A0A8B6HGF0_MYTGA|nr:splicing factor, arginine/serine-rich 3 [Mytilus galloprovincialis]